MIWRRKSWNLVVGTRMSVLTVVSVMSFDDMTRSG